MYKKARLPMELGCPVILFKLDKGNPKIEAKLTLEEFTIQNGRIEWRIIDEQGRIIDGRVKQNATMPQYSDAWVTLCIPITVHYFRTVSPEFLFHIPSSRRIISQHQFAKEFPNVAL